MSDIKKVYYTMPEVSRIVGIPSWQIRYLEEHFGTMHDRRRKENTYMHRIFKEDGIDKLKKIKPLLEFDRYELMKIIIDENITRVK